jgi:hypothetical protein
MGRSLSSLEGFMIVNGKEGEQFYTRKDSRFVTTLCNYYKRRVNTAKCVVTYEDGTNIRSEYVVLVTLGKFKKDEK